MSKQTKSTASNKATHSGSCQWCGAQQKLPKGVLSTHGYTVRWGFFSGICHGTGHLPFEQSCDLIEGAIVSATKQLEALRQFQADLRKPATEPKAWVSQYVEGDRFTKSGYVQYQAVILSEEIQYQSGDGSYTKYSFFQQKGKAEGKRTEIQTNYSDKTVLDVCTTLNRRHADAQEGIAQKIEEYIRWQTKRVKGWKPGKIKALAEDAVQQVSVSGLPSGYHYKGTIKALLDENTAVIRIKFTFAYRNFSWCFIKATKSPEGRWVYAGKTAAVK